MNTTTDADQSLDIPLDLRYHEQLVVWHASNYIQILSELADPRAPAVLQALSPLIDAVYNYRCLGGNLYNPDDRRPPK